MNFHLYLNCVNCHSNISTHLHIEYNLTQQYYTSYYRCCKKKQHINKLMNKMSKAK